ncbi:putative membrane protein [Nitrobacteraceae bacterium AZCC 2161]|jgi:uncharacterized membrane protein
MIAIPHKTLREIDAALNAPNMQAIRRTLDDAAKQIRPLVELARQDRENDLSNRHRFNIGSYR